MRDLNCYKSESWSQRVSLKISLEAAELLLFSAECDQRLQRDFFKVFSSSFFLKKNEMEKV